MEIVKLNKLVKDVRQELLDFQTGKKKVIITKRPWLDDIFPVVNGSVITIVAPSGVGKSTEMMTVAGNIMDTSINPDADKYVFLNISLEMKLFNLVLRGLSKTTHKNKSEIIREEFTDEEQELVDRYLDAFSDDRNFVSQVPTSPAKFFTACKNFLEQHKDKETVLIACDHLALLNSDKGESRNTVIEQFCERVNDLKMLYPNVVFLLVSQANGDILNRAREKDRMSQPRQTDVYYSQFTFQISDYVVFINNPLKMGVKEYSKVSPDIYPNLEKYYVTQDSKGRWSLDTYGVLYFHLLKVREADDANYLDIYAEDLKGIQGLEERRKQYNQKKKDDDTPPVFNEPENHYKSLNPIEDMNEAFGGGDNDIPY